MATNKNLLLTLKSAKFGDAEPELGEKLLKLFLNALYESGTIPDKIICSGTAIFLTTGGSDAAELLQKFQTHGSEILSCSTCLDYYKRKELLAIGKPTNMKDAVTMMLGYQRIIQP